MKKKLFDIFFIAAFLVLCTALSVGTWLFGPAQAAANEKLAEMPAFVTEEGSINRDYLSQLQNFVNDRFFLRQKLITLDRRFSNLLGVSGEDSVIAGRDGWLFFADTLGDYTGTTPMSNRELFSAASNVALMESYCRSTGKEFTFIIAPNKNSLYGEFMPDFGVTSQTSNAEKFHNLLDQFGVPYVDLFAAFESAEEVLYFAHDSHWNSKGAALGADLINRSFGLQTDYFGADFSESIPHEGDLYAMVFPGATDGENDPVYGGQLNFVFTSKATQPDAINLTTEGNGTGSLLCYRDSFGILLFPYLADSYKTAKFSRTVNYDLSGSEDYVAIELVERNLRYLIKNVPVMPSPARQLELPAAVSGSASVAKAENARAGSGCVQFAGTLPVKPDADACVYVVCSGVVYEAFCLEQDGFAVNVPEDAVPQYLVYHIGGVPQMFEIQ
jgi:hypothetical protein